MNKKLVSATVLGVAIALAVITPDNWAFQKIDLLLSGAVESSLVLMFGSLLLN